MLHYRLHQDNRKTSKTKGNWYGHIVTRNTYDIEALAQYMANHNTPFSKGTIKGILNRHGGKRQRTKPCRKPCKD